MKPPDVTVIILMGVSGCGKTTIGKKLAAELGRGWAFLDADDFHPPASIAKMSAGVPLDDADRAPWLAAMRTRLDACAREGECVVLACSALKARYRAVLAGGLLREKAMLVYLKGARALLLKRLGERSGHFMKAAMLDSQFAALEAPQAGEAARVIVADISKTTDEVVDEIRRGAGL